MLLYGFLLRVHAGLNDARARRSGGGDGRLMRGVDLVAAVRAAVQEVDAGVAVHVVAADVAVVAV